MISSRLVLVVLIFTLPAAIMPFSWMHSKYCKKNMQLYGLAVMPIEQSVAQRTIRKRFAIINEEKSCLNLNQHRQVTKWITSTQPHMSTYAQTQIHNETIEHRAQPNDYYVYYSPKWEVLFFDDDDERQRMYGIHRNGRTIQQNTCIVYTRCGGLSRVMRDLNKTKSYVGEFK